MKELKTKNFKKGTRRFLSFFYVFNRTQLNQVILVKGKG